MWIVQQIIFNWRQPMQCQMFYIISYHSTAARNVRSATLNENHERRKNCVCTLVCSAVEQTLCSLLFRVFGNGNVRLTSSYRSKCLRSHCSLCVLNIWTVVHRSSIHSNQQHSAIWHDMLYVPCIIVYPLLSLSTKLENTGNRKHFEPMLRRNTLISPIMILLIVMATFYWATNIEQLSMFRRGNRHHIHMEHGARSTEINLFVDSIWRFFRWEFCIRRWISDSNGFCWSCGCRNLQL